MRGTLPQEMTLLTEISQFIVADHALEGSINGLSANWSKLRELGLSRNKFTGPFPPSMDVENPALRVLRLHENQFTGELPATIGNLTQLEQLDIDDNEFAGGIPIALGRLTKLSKSHRLNHRACNANSSPAHRTAI